MTEHWTWLPHVEAYSWSDASLSALTSAWRVPARDVAPARGGVCGAEGWGPASPQRVFDLTPCFQGVVLWALPSLVFVAAAAILLRRHAHNALRHRSAASLRRLREKDATAIGVLVLSVVELVALVAERMREAHVSSVVTGVQFASLAAQLVAYGCALALQHTNHLRARRGSDAVQLFFFLHVFTGPVRVRTLLSPPTPRSGEVLAAALAFALRWALVMVGMVLESLPVDEPGKEGAVYLDERTEARAEPAYTDAEGGAEREPENELSYVDTALDVAECPVVTASLFSRVSFQWLQPLMSLGARKFLSESDMWALPRGDEAEALGNTFQRTWMQLEERAREHGREPSKTHRSRFWRSVLSSCGRPFFIAAVFKVAQDSLAFTTPQVLRLLLAFVRGWQEPEPGAPRPQTVLQGYVLAVLLFVVSMAQVVCLHQYFQLVGVAGMQARSSVVSAIFRKSLRLTNEERSKRATGDIVNLMSVDANRLPDFFMYAHILWSALFQITLAFISLYRLLGWSSFVGVGIMIFSLPLNMVLANYMRNMSAKQMKIKDRRTQLMNEIILNIKSIKLFAWEPAFIERLMRVRNGEELPLLRQIGAASSLFNFFWSAIPFFVSLGTFIAFASTSETPLTADIVFPALSLYQLLNFPLTMLAGIVSMFLQTQVSADRLGDFFESSELRPDTRSLELQAPRGAEPSVEMSAASFKWAQSQQGDTLRDISLRIAPGELVAVLGRVGDGKTSLLSAILGEMGRTSGSLTLRGRTALFSQGGWCMGASVRDNVLFGREYDEAHYRRCIDACALGPDLALLPNGDQTEIGERGVSLSGGQKARVALARACYAAADVYLLDDPLAAVDAHVGKHLWNNVIGPNGMLRDCTRILTLNAVSYLPACDRLITMRGGSLLGEQGTFEEVMAMRGEVYKLITGLGRQREDANENGRPGHSASGSRSSGAPQPDSAPLAHPRELGKEEVKIDTIRQLRESSMPQERQEHGSVKREVYQQYAESASVAGVVLYVCAQAITQAFTVSRDVVLKQWSSANARNGDTSDASVNTFYLTLYAVVGMAASVGFCVAPLILYVWLVPASAQRIHDKLFRAVLRYPLQWFETTPSGRLLNLFSRDVSVLDEVMPRVIHGTVRSSIVVVGVMCVVSYSVPPFVLLVVPLAYMYRAVMRYYLATSRELKRIDAVSKSPVFTWFQESLGGLSSIRAYGQAARFTDAFEARVDRNQMCYFPAMTVNRWLAVRIELIGALVVVFSSSVSVLLATTAGGRMSAGLLGLMLSQVLSTTQTLNWAVRSASDVEQNIVSVERILSYSELETEAPYELPETRPPPSWPGTGEIVFHNYSTRYRRELEPVLRNLSFRIAPGERIGVVGRTGAGKSSLTLALFRILEPITGYISIDGANTSSLGLRELRSALAIIPQDPQLWQGTLRQNLDPLEQHTDAELVNVLNHARLGSLLDASAERLDMAVAEGGTNFSAGQRQLICIARALVRRTKILVLDEATSSIDLETDESIQQIVRSEFKGTTITIAHRLNTILDSTRVLVLRNGEVAELDTPAKLLADDQSVLHSMAVEAGLDTAIEAAKGAGGSAKDTGKLVEVDEKPAPAQPASADGPPNGPPTEPPAGEQAAGEAVTEGEPPADAPAGEAPGAPPAAKASEAPAERQSSGDAQPEAPTGARQPAHGRHRSGKRHKRRGKR